MTDNKTKDSATLVLANGSVFHGVSVGAAGTSVGEVVFNTAMTGYQEILTDPSYAGQLVCLTYPHVGNTGVNSVDCEAAKPMAAGLIIRDLPVRASSYRRDQNLDDYLKQHGVVAIAEIDTRRLTRLLRDQGAMNGVIATANAATGESDLESLHRQARAAPDMTGQDLAAQVSCQSTDQWQQATWDLRTGAWREVPGDGPRVVAYDFGVKSNILRLLSERGCQVRRVPAKTDPQQIIQARPDGVFLSNGPGDPEPCAYAIEAIKQFLEAGIPVFGICLGHQLLALAVGARTVKMKFGHHGANHPVKDLATGRVHITSQNHGFAVNEESLPENVRVTHRSLFDGTIQGIELTDAPAFSFQGHPEASPGPHDIHGLFDRFMHLMANQSRAA